MIRALSALKAVRLPERTLPKVTHPAALVVRSDKLKYALKETSVVVKLMSWAKGTTRCKRLNEMLVKSAELLAARLEEASLLFQ